MEAIAKTKYLKGSPRKARLVIDLIRGRNVSQALAILKFTDKRATDPISKCLSSAIANATYLAEQQNIAIDPDDLWVKTCFVDMGPHKNRRRMRPAPQGRAYKEQRHYCHITIHVTSDEKPVDLKRIKNSKNGEEGDKSGGEKKTGVKKARASAQAVKSDDAKEKIPNMHLADASNVETTENVNTAVEETSPKATEASKETVENVTENEAMASDVKNVQSQTDAEQHETKPADEAQLNRNEELERQ